jgi:hypothetical protein
MAMALNDADVGKSCSLKCALRIWHAIMTWLNHAGNRSFHTSNRQ